MGMLISGILVRKLLNDGTSSWKFGDSGAATYGSNTNGALISPVYSFLPSTVEFYQFMATEVNYDGGKLEYNLDGAGWLKVPDAWFISGGYNGVDDANGPQGFTAGEDVWTGHIGSSSSFQTVVADLSSVSGSNIQFRFQFASDGNTEEEGWYVDSFTYGVGGTKGVVPMNSGSPFYTTSQNPVTCSNMKAGDSCTSSWSVFANGPAGVYTFFVDYTALDSHVSGVQSSSVDVEIVESSVGCALLFDTIPPCDCIDNTELLTAITQWYADGASLGILMQHIKAWKDNSYLCP